MTSGQVQVLMQKLDKIIELLKLKKKKKHKPPGPKYMERGK